MMQDLSVLLTPVVVPVGLFICLLLFRSLRLFIRDIRVKQRGGIRAPQIPNDPISGILYFFLFFYHHFVQVSSY